MWLGFWFVQRAYAFVYLITLVRKLKANCRIHHRVAKWVGGVFVVEDGSDALLYNLLLYVGAAIATLGTEHGAVRIY